MDDARLLFEWVNSAESPAGKLRTSGSILWSVHVEWLSRRLADPSCAIWIADHDGTPVGQARVELRDGALEVDIFVEPTFGSGDRLPNLNPSGFISGDQECQS